MIEPLIKYNEKLKNIERTFGGGFRSEIDFQDYFERFLPQFITDILGVRFKTIIREAFLKAGCNKRVDFLVVDYVGNYHLIELKRPVNANDFAGSSLVAVGQLLLYEALLLEDNKLCGKKVIVSSRLDRTVSFTDIGAGIDFYCVQEAASNPRDLQVKNQSHPLDRDCILSGNNTVAGVGRCINKVLPV